MRNIREDGGDRGFVLAILKSGRGKGGTVSILGHHLDGGTRTHQRESRRTLRDSSNRETWNYKQKLLLQVPRYGFGWERSCKVESLTHVAPHLPQPLSLLVGFHALPYDL